LDTKGLKQYVEEGKVRAAVADAVRDGAVQTESGLIVPRAAADAQKKRQVWRWAEWKVVRRTVTFFAERGVRMTLSCTECGLIFTPARAEDGFDLACRCTIREIRPRT
jgi:hypothetical protein